MTDIHPVGLLLVDDEEKILSALRRLFHPVGYKVYIATNGDDGLKILESENISVVISDMKMPWMSGAVFLEKVAEKYPDIQRIVLSGQADMQDTVDVINTAGVFKFLHKPWDPDELISVVRNAVRLYERKVSDERSHRNTQDLNTELKSYSQKLEMSVQQKNAKLEKASDRLASAYEGERKLRQAQKEAERLSEAKGRFLATMSHEIRSPLNAVIAMNALLLESDLSDEQRELAKIAHDGGKSLLALINDILDFSKIEAGKLQLSEDWFNTVELMESITELSASQTIDKPVEIVTVVSPGTPSQLLGDQTRVRQILMNLISNAVKFTERGGVTIRLSPARQGLCIEVLDTGIGISKKEQETIFNEFVQADDSDSRAYGGTGLGLSICKQLVSLMNGEILLDSQLGIGSCFTVSLPLEGRKPVVYPEIKTDKILLCFDTLNEVLFDGVKEQLSYLNCETVRRSELSDFTRRYKNTDKEEVSFDKNLFYLVDIKDRSIDAQQYLTDFEKQLKDVPQFAPLENGFHWELIGLLPNDGVGKLNELKQKGFSRLLRKPVRMSNIVSYIQPSSTSEKKSKEKISEPSVSKNQELSRPLNILLAEDSPTNQAVMKAILKNNCYHVDIANNGLEAVGMCMSTQYDIILMDLSMPLMDGVGATEKIRAVTGKNQQTTIIAMTANAFAEDKERCFAVGMNDFLSKPIDVGEFIACISSWAEKNVSTLVENEGAIEQDSHSRQSENKDTGDFDNCLVADIVDENVLCRVANDTSWEVLPEILDIYYTETEKRVPEMYGFYQTKDWHALGDEAHTLKSSSGSFGAFVLQEKAKNIEFAVRNGDYAHIDDEMRTLKNLAQRSISALRESCQKHSS